MNHHVEHSTQTDVETDESLVSPHDFSQFIARQDAFFGNNIITPNPAMRFRAFKKGLIAADTHIDSLHDYETIDAEKFISETSKFLDHQQDTRNIKILHDELDLSSSGYTHSTRWILEATGIKFEIVKKLKEDRPIVLELLKEIIALNASRKENSLPHMEEAQLRSFCETVIYGFELGSTKQLLKEYMHRN